MTGTVVFVSREGKQLPGARLRCYQLARALRKLDVDAHTLSFRDVLGAHDGALEHRDNWGRKLQLNLKAYRCLRRRRDTVIVLQRCHYHVMGPWLAHRANGARMILDVDDWEMRENPKYFGGWWPSSKAEYLLRQLARSSNACVAASQFLRRSLTRYGVGVDYVPTPVDTSRFYASGDQPQRGCRFVWVGTLHRPDDVENVMFVVRCYEQVKRVAGDISLHLVGSGRYANRLTEFLRSTTMSDVTWHGWISPHKVPVLLRTMDVGVLPLTQRSRFNRSKSPTKLFEYMATGLPSVSSAIGESQRVLEHGRDGLLAHTKRDFENYMLLLAKDGQLRTELGNAALELVQRRYALSVAALHYRSILERVLQV